MPVVHIYFLFEGCFYLLRWSQQITFSFIFFNWQNWDLQHKQKRICNEQRKKSAEFFWNFCLLTSLVTIPSLFYSMAQLVFHVEQCQHYILSCKPKKFFKDLNLLEWSPLHNSPLSIGSLPCLQRLDQGRK
jgi:hypothetical protein